MRFRSGWGYSLISNGFWRLFLIRHETDNIVKKGYILSLGSVNAHDLQIEI